ncbi:protein kinase domain-containing protein [Actinopolymorpha rutila]|uniref:non-specific serine/threonine protein kinase n=1 Tax=Actinopolymorpha rutila TaxID=446787 RepID=A0A852ZEI2_9ACTN|nr:protein kinase [Actinopolymorpha rutila]NYH91314.1 hypothetical protein [Actinopolymorpha rutila]
MADVGGDPDGGRYVASAADPDPGRLFAGRYRVGSRIGSGGMALVYRAYDTWLHRTVALKVPACGPPGDPAFVRRFRREARAVASLSHPNVVTVHDCAQWAGRPYLTMEFVDGPTLRDLLADGAPMEPDHALALTEQVLRGLAAAHEVGLVHRDVKPANVLICTDGTVKVADFGLARSASASSADSRGIHVGTAYYLAPEQIIVGTVDARADVYAVGIMLYEMLTGARPFQDGSTVQIAYSHAHQDVPLPSWTVPSLPAELDTLVGWATNRDREFRPADAQVLLDQVTYVRSSMAWSEDVRDAARVDAARVDAMDPAPRRAGTGGPARHRRLGVALALLAVAVAVAAVTAAVVWRLSGAGPVANVPEAVGTPQNESNRLETTEPTEPARTAGPPAAIAPPEPTRAATEPGTAAVPDVRRLGTDEARMTLSDAGFEVEVRKNRPYVGGNIVVRQSPAAGRSAKPGSKVVIIIA